MSQQAFRAVKYSKRMAEKGVLTGLLCNVNKFPGLVVLDFDKRDDEL